MTYIEDEDVSFFDTKFNVTFMHFIFFALLKLKNLIFGYFKNFLMGPFSAEFTGNNVSLCFTLTSLIPGMKSRGS